MITLRQAAQAAKGELWQLDFIDLDNAEVKDKVFIKVEKIDGKDVSRQVAYKVMLIDGKEYNLREKQLNQLKELLENKPLCKKVKLMKLEDGKLLWIGIDVPAEKI
jgi:hypothetical protein